MAQWHTCAEKGDAEGLSRLIASRAKNLADPFMARFYDDPIDEKDDLDEGKDWRCRR